MIRSPGIPFPPAALVRVAVTVTDAPVCVALMVWLPLDVMRVSARFVPVIQSVEAIVTFGSDVPGLSVKVLPVPPVIDWLAYVFQVNACAEAQPPVVVPVNLALIVTLIDFPTTNDVSLVDFVTSVITCGEVVEIDCTIQFEGTEVIGPNEPGGVVSVKPTGTVIWTCWMKCSGVHVWQRSCE